MIPGAAMRIVVVGSGYVGLVAGTGFAEFGNTVQCVDSDRAKIDALLAGEIPIYEPGLEELVRHNVAEQRLGFSTDLAAAVADAEMVFIAVGTPPKEDGSADLKHVLAVAEALAKVTINAPSVPVVANVTAAPVSDPEQIRRLLVQQVTGTVRWRECVLAMAAAGVTELYELGSGKVLSGLAGRIDKSLKATPVGTPADVEAAVTLLKG